MPLKDSKRHESLTDDDHTTAYREEQLLDRNNDTMGRNWRHVKTLTRKNFINWRRTWLGSFLELALPALIMGALCFYKINESPESVPEEKLLHYATAQYPVTQQVGINYYLYKN